MTDKLTLQSRQFLDEVQNSVDGIEELLYTKQISKTEAIACANNIQNKLDRMHDNITAITMN